LRNGFKSAKKRLNRAGGGEGKRLQPQSKKKEKREEEAFKKRVWNLCSLREKTSRALEREEAERGAGLGPRFIRGGWYQERGGGRDEINRRYN